MPRTSAERSTTSSRATFGPALRVIRRSSSSRVRSLEGRSPGARLRGWKVRQGQRRRIGYLPLGCPQELAWVDGQIGLHRFVDLRGEPPHVDGSFGHEDTLVLLRVIIFGLPARCLRLPAGAGAARRPRQRNERIPVLPRAGAVDDQPRKDTPCTTTSSSPLRLGIFNIGRLPWVLRPSIEVEQRECE